MKTIHFILIKIFKRETPSLTLSYFEVIWKLEFHMEILVQRNLAHNQIIIK